MINDRALIFKLHCSDTINKFSYGHYRVIKVNIFIKRSVLQHSSARMKKERVSHDWLYVADLQCISKTRQIFQINIFLRVV